MALSASRSPVAQRDPRPLGAQRGPVCCPQEKYMRGRIEQTPVGPHPASGAEVLKLCNFYTGVTLSLCGVGAFFVGATSRKWVEVEGVGFGYPHKSLAHMGPWLACTKDNHCDRPWVLAPGIGERLVRAVQTLLVFTIVTYLSGAGVVVLQVLRPRKLMDLRFCNVLLNNVFTECLLPVAAVMALVFILMMGELKRKLILHFDQTSRPGWAFVVCLTSVLATVAGSVCITFNRDRSGAARASCVTLFGKLSTHPYNRMSEKRESVRRNLVTFSTTQQGPDMRSAAANHNISPGDSRYESASENIRDKCRDQVKINDSDEAERNSSRVLYDSTVEHCAEQEGGTNLVGLREQHVFEHCSSVPALEQQVTTAPINLQSPLEECGYGDRPAAARACDVRGRQIGRTRPQTLPNPRVWPNQSGYGREIERTRPGPPHTPPHLLQGKTDWSRAYQRTHERTVQEEDRYDDQLHLDQLDVGCAVLHVCSEVPGTSRQAKYKSQDIHFKTGEVNL